MKYAYLHIGLEKTGTTSLQACLKKNEKQLEEAGFSYFCDDSKPYFSGLAHAPLAGCFHAECPKFIPEKKFGSPPDVLGPLREDGERCPHHIILSSEHFSSRLHEREMLKALQDALPGRKMKIICYLRRQDHMALAAFSTMVLYGRTREFCVSDVINTRLRYYNYYDICLLWASVFGKDNVILREFDRDRLEKGDVRYDFLNVIDVDPAPFSFGENQNLSLDATQVEVLRAINRSLQNTKSDNRKAYDTDQDIRLSLLDVLPKGKSLSTLLSECDRNTILNYFEPSNRKLAQIFDHVDFLYGWHEGEGGLSSGKEVVHHSSQDVDFSETIVRLAQQLILVRQDNTRLTSELTNSEKKVRSISNEWEKVTKSSSWRLTAPLRWVGLTGRRIRSFFNRLR